MFRFTESIEIAAPPDKIWDTLADIEKWWPPSNPEHISIEVQSADEPIGVGTEIVFAERIAGIKGEAAGSLTTWIPSRKAAWKGAAVYWYHGLPLHIQEGVSWMIENQGNLSRLSVTVWALFPSNIFGRLAEWYAVKFLHLIARDREHARCELEFLKGMIESGIEGESN